MRIMFHTLSLGRGGAERVISNLCTSLPNNYEKSIVISQNNEVGYDFPSDVNIINLNPNRKNNFMLKNITILKNLLKNIKKNNPDIVVCFLNEASMRTLFLKKFGLVSKKTKIIVSVRNDPKVIYNSFMKRFLMKMLFKKADGFVFQTNDAMNFFDNKIKEKGTVIPNPINELFINQKLHKGRRKKEIVTVGRLTEQKNHKLLIDAFFEVSKKHPEYKLKIFGDGPLKKWLEQYINEKKVNENVILMGVSDNLQNDICDSGIFVLSSLYEGMPNALMEALALGLPCISTDCPCGGPKFLIENNNNGILIENENKDDLVSSILYLIENGDVASKMGERAKEKSKNFSPEKINNMWVDYIRSVIKSEY